MRQGAVPKWLREQSAKLRCSGSTPLGASTPRLCVVCLVDLVHLVSLTDIVAMGSEPAGHDLRTVGAGPPAGWKVHGFFRRSSKQESIVPRPPSSSRSAGPTSIYKLRTYGMSNALREDRDASACSSRSTGLYSSVLLQLTPCLNPLLLPIRIPHALFSDSGA